MTYNERAVKIAPIICSLLNVTPTSRQDANNYDAVVKEIAAELKQAVEEQNSQPNQLWSIASYEIGKAEAYEECAKTHHDKHLLNEVCVPCFQKGKEAAYEDATKIAFRHGRQDSCTGITGADCGDAIANAIRARAKETK